MVIGAFSLSSSLSPSSRFASTTVQASRPSQAVALPSAPSVPAVRVPVANAMIAPGPSPVQPAASLPANRIDPAPEVRAELQRPAASLAPMTSSGPARAEAAAPGTAAQAYTAGGSGGGGAPILPPGFDRASAPAPSSSAPAPGNPRAAGVTSGGPSPVILAAGAVAAGLVLWRVLHG